MKNQGFSSICGVRATYLIMLAGLMLSACQAGATTIQAQINAASAGQTINVGPGVYHEDLTLKSGVNVIGAGFGSTILVGSGTNYVVTANGVSSCTFAGFTVTGATNQHVFGYIGGFELESSTVVIQNNLIISNILGIDISLGSPIIRNNIIQANGTPNFESQALWCNSGSPYIANNLIISNYNGAMYLNSYADPAVIPQVINNTIADNVGTGLECDYSNTPVVMNNIIYGNQYGVSAGTAGSVPVMSYNDVYDNSVANYVSSGGGVAAPGTGDISTDPLFDPTSPVSFFLAPASPCIHTGNPDPMYNNPDGTRNTRGAYGGPGALSPQMGTAVTSGFVFTSVGNVPTAVITQSGASDGLANVPANVASALNIYPWEDAPFGGQPYLYGLFGSSDTSVLYYQIWGAPWPNSSTPPGLANFRPILDPLSKYKYVIQGNGTVQTTLVNVGPDANGLYSRTDLPNSGYWSAPDLKLILNTYELQNGRWDFICQGYSSDNTNSLVTLPSNQFSRITLWIDNNPVTVSITSVLDQYSNSIPVCGSIDLATSEQNLQFEFTAYHPTGFLNSYAIGAYYGQNQYGGVIASDQYVGVHDGAGRPFWSGVGPGTAISNSLPAQVAGVLEPWQTCAYQFELSATARTIDGFNQIYYTDFNDHYYIQVGAMSPTMESISITAPHTVQITATGVANQLYYVESTTNLKAPANQWLQLGSVSASPSGAITFVDPTATNSHRFYQFFP